MQKLTTNKTNEYGLIYTLPLTEINLTVEAEKTVRTPGEFFRYAKKYLGIDPILEPSATYAVKSAVVTSSGVPDQDERYLVQFKSGSHRSSSWTTTTSRWLSTPRDARPRK